MKVKTKPQQLTEDFSQKMASAKNFKLVIMKGQLPSLTYRIIDFLCRPFSYHMYANCGKTLNTNS